MGVAFARGEGRPKNKDKALQWYDKGCTLGSWYSCSQARALRRQ